MTVLLDIEWIEKEEKHLSQISAIRVDEEWTEISRIDLFVNLGTECLHDNNHVAFGGYDISHFENGLTEMQSIMRLNHWLESDDYILVWAKSNKIKSTYSPYGKETWGYEFPIYLIPQMQLESLQTARTRKIRVHTPYSRIWEKKFYIPNIAHQTMLRCSAAY